jgi:hypothetical protein
VRLSWKEWIVAAAILGGMLLAIPRFWAVLEEFDPPPDYRLPYQLSEDYWLFTRWGRYACSNFPALIIGDSVIWGQYVSGEQTLSHYLNDMMKESAFANVGVDGLHPAAMGGLIKYYGKDISDKAVVLHFNPLWMSSKRHDLRGEEEFRFNHPGLVPQFMPDLACYRPSLGQRIDAVTERSLSFFAWVKHVRSVYFENMDIPNWTLQNPHRSPLHAITLELPLPEKRPKSKPVPWTERAMQKQDFPWVEPEASFQWESFRKAIGTLRARNNAVFVLIGPFNPSVMSEKSLSRYRAVLSRIEAWLEENRIAHYSVPDLPSEYYADASHPLAAGYARIAGELFRTESFQEWMEKMRGGGP